MLSLTLFLLFLHLLFSFVDFDLDLSLYVFKDLKVVELLSFLKFGLAYTIWVVVGVDAVFSLLFAHLNLFDNRYQIVAQSFEDSFNVKFFEFYHYFME